MAKHLEQILKDGHLEGALFGYDDGMRKIEKPSPTESPLLFEVDRQPAEEMLTALGGLPLVVQAFRSLGLPGNVKQHVVVKERQGGYDEATVAESFVLLNAAGASGRTILSICERPGSRGDDWSRDTFLRSSSELSVRVS